MTLTQIDLVGTSIGQQTSGLLFSLSGPLQIDVAPGTLTTFPPATTDSFTLAATESVPVNPDPDYDLRLEIWLIRQISNSAITVWRDQYPLNGRKTRADIPTGYVTVDLLCWGEVEAGETDLSNAGTQLYFRSYS